MSYCRFSSDDFQCDIYVYESVMGGFSINVAGNRVVFKEAIPAPMSWNDDQHGWMDRHARISRMVDEADRVAIDLPQAGESWRVDTAEEAAAELLRLRAAGYVVPQYAIDALIDEASA